jgi:hypothetical protein
MRGMAISVPAAARDDYALARAYLRRDPVERRIFDRLEHSARRYQLSINDRNDDHFDPSTDTIAWDPHSALRTTSGGRQSPALGLGHEADHAVESRSRERILNARSDPRYDTREERRVICGSERHAARTLGEAGRSDHTGTCYRVSTPVSR